MPPAASGPVFTVKRPILIGAFCAIAGIGNAAAAAAPASIWRRFSLMVMDLSPSGAALLAEAGREKFNHRGRGGSDDHLRLRDLGPLPTIPGCSAIIFRNPSPESLSFRGMAVRNLRIERQPGELATPRRPVARDNRPLSSHRNLLQYPRPRAVRWRMHLSLSPPEGSDPWVRTSRRRDAVTSACWDPLKS